jgi:hypothetical protein
MLIFLMNVFSKPTWIQEKIMLQVSRPQTQFIAVKSADSIEVNIVYLAFLLFKYLSFN